MYYWIRVYDYNFERDSSEKGTLLDEFYLKDIYEGRNEVKEVISKKYDTDFIKNLKYAKPRKKDGVYSIVMESSKFFYDRFMFNIDTLCFNCYKNIKGKAVEFPKKDLRSMDLFFSSELDLTDLENTAYFCNSECKSSHIMKLKNVEGDFQIREEDPNRDIFGYIYEIYNREEDKYYVGQTKYMPFFRWQDHVKDGSKGDLCALSFSVITSINKSYQPSEDQKYMNSIESWWIQKYVAEGKSVFNIVIPTITIEDLKSKFLSMIEKNN